MLNDNTLKSELMNIYNEHNYCNGNYIFVVYDRHTDTYKAIDIKHTNIEPVVQLNKASRGYGARLRYRQTEETVIWLLQRAIEVYTIATGEEFRNYADTILNRGERAEYFVYRYHGQTWTRNNVPFYKGADITDIEGIPWQIKSHDATIITESTARRLQG